jgi:Sap, sulfolipid-1-addressing protein
MAHIVLLAVAAAVFPTLIACVAIMISRPEPRPVLGAFYAGAVIVSVSADIVVLDAFNNGGAVLGNTPSAQNPATLIVAGLVALLLAWLMVSDRGRAPRRWWRSRRPPLHTQETRPSWAERHLARANAAVAFAIGAAINLPGPFYLLALGEIAKGPYDRLESTGLILLFNAIMFTLLEVPLLGYLVRPERTTDQVGGSRPGSTPTACGSWAGWSRSSG